MIGTLPPELVLRTLSYLPLQSLGNVRLVSRSWNEFCVTNQCTIYHEAAVLHKFVSCIEMPLTEARETYAKGSLKDASDWYEYCELRVCHSWRSIIATHSILVQVDGVSG